MASKFSFWYEVTSSGTHNMKPKTTYHGRVDVSGVVDGETIDIDEVYFIETGNLESGNNLIDLLSNVISLQPFFQEILDKAYIHCKEKGLVK